MKEKLTIENFAGIDYLELELNQINILIGPQASGKSIIIKLFFFFKSYFDDLKTGIEKGISHNAINEEFKNKFISFFPKVTWPKEKFLLVYEIDKSRISLSREMESTLIIKLSESFLEIYDEAKNKYSEIEEKSTSYSEISLQFVQGFNSLMEEKISKKYPGNQIFIPAGRSFFSILQSNIFTFLHSKNSLDPFLTQFGFMYEKIKKSEFEEQALPDKFNIDNENLDKIIRSVLKSDYKRINNNDYLFHENNRVVNLANASSGQQEILPLIVLLKSIISFSFSNEWIVLYIEEPEAHLYPNSQKLIIRLFAQLFNSSKNEFQIIITTHSPYILSSFNNLMYAGSLVNSLEGKKKEKVYKIVNESEVINPKYVSAYSLEIGGKKKNLIDLSTGLIAQNALDDVSNDISIEFGKLLDLED